MSEIEEVLPPEEPTEELETPIEPDPPKPPSKKLLIFDDGINTYEVGEWLHGESYPNSLTPYYIVDEGTEEGAALIQKIKSLYPYFTLTVVDGELWDVMEREKTPEETEAENAPPPKSAEQLEIEQLKTELADVQLALAELFTI